MVRLKPDPTYCLVTTLAGANMVFPLIFDLTHERQGTIDISQQPLIDVQGLFAKP